MTLENHSLEHAIEVYLLRTDVEGKSPNTVVAYRETLWSEPLRLDTLC